MDHWTLPLSAEGTAELLAERTVRPVMTPERARLIATVHRIVMANRAALQRLADR